MPSLACSRQGENKIETKALDFEGVALQKATADGDKENNFIIYALDKDIRFISELTGQFFANPLLSISLAI